jgi:putative NIF3 family GTP cyclohydrolase 1 type 2
MRRGRRYAAPSQPMWYIMIMIMEDAVTRLLAALPYLETWERSLGECYGPGHIIPERIVRKALYAVTITPEVEDLFMGGGYDFLFAHHPFRPRKAIPHFLAHTAFDCCVGGLNDLWAEKLGLRDANPITDHLGRFGRIEPVSFEALCERIRDISGGIEGQVHGGENMIESVAVCSGLGGWIAREAEATRADVFVTGELSQPAASLAFPGVIEMGHTRSERVGVEVIRRILGSEVQVDAAPLGIDYFSEEIYRPIGR